MSTPSQPSVTLESNSIRVAGSVNFETVMSLYDQGLSLFRDRTEIKVDLAAALNEDSSILALLSAWMRYAVENKKKLVFNNIPTALKNLMRLNGLDTVFPLQS